MPTASKRIGDMQGWWSLGFKALIVVNGIIVTPLILFCFSVKSDIRQLKLSMADRWSSEMVEAGEEMRMSKNDNYIGLTHSEIRKIQRDHPVHKIE